MRRLEERQLLDGGWTTEWEPAALPTEGKEGLAVRCANLDTERGWALLVRELNKLMKAEGRAIQYRSVAIEEP